MEEGGSAMSGDEESRSPLERTNNDDFPNNFGVSSSSLSVFLNRFRQMDAKKLQQLASSSAAITQTIVATSSTNTEENTDTDSATSAREKAFKVVYGSREANKPSRSKPKMCFVLDSNERQVRITSRDEQQKQEHSLIMLEDIPDEQLSRFGRVVDENFSEETDRCVHCDVCCQFYDFSCFEHPLYHCKDRSTNINASPSDSDDRAAATLPAFLYIQNSSIPNAGKGVFTKVDVPKGIVFGPYEGILRTSPKRADLGGYAWELRTGGREVCFLDGKDPRYSNWMRYINAPRNESEQNLIAFQYCGSVYYRVFKPIDRASELLVWYGKSFGRELGIISDEAKRIGKAFVYYPGKSPFLL